MKLYLFFTFFSIYFCIPCSAQLDKDDQAQYIFYRVVPQRPSLHSHDTASFIDEQCYVHLVPFPNKENTSELIFKVASLNPHTKTIALFDPSQPLYTLYCSLPKYSCDIFYIHLKDIDLISGTPHDKRSYEETHTLLTLYTYEYLSMQFQKEQMNETDYSLLAFAQAMQTKRESTYTYVHAEDSDVYLLTEHIKTEAQKEEFIRALPQTVHIPHASAYTHIHPIKWFGTIVIIYCIFKAIRNFFNRPTVYMHYIIPIAK